MAREVTVYTQPGCPPCKQVKEYLTHKGVSFVEKDIRQDPTAIDDLRRIGAMSTPVIVVDGTPVIGFDERQLSELLTAGASG